MNPKKQIMKFLQEVSSGHSAEACDVSDRVRRIQEGMSTGTATVLISDAMSDKYAEDFQLKHLENRGRYFTGQVVDQHGKVIENLLVDKQTGEVRFLW